MSKRLEEMTIDEVEELLGPGSLVPDGDVWLSRRWQCGRCERVFAADIPVEMPLKCGCESVIFVRLPNVTH